MSALDPSIFSVWKGKFPTIKEEEEEERRRPVALLDPANESTTTIGQDPPAQTFSRHDLKIGVESKRVLFQETTLIAPEAMLHLIFHDNP